MPLWQCKYMNIPYMKIEHSAQHASSQKRSLSSSETQLPQQPSLMESTKTKPPPLLGLQRNTEQKCFDIFCCTIQRKPHGKLIKTMHCHNCPTYTINNHWWHHETQVCNTDRTKLDVAKLWFSVCWFPPHCCCLCERTVFLFDNDFVSCFLLRLLILHMCTGQTFILSKNPSFDIIHGEYFVFPSPLTWIILQVRGK